MAGPCAHLKVLELATILAGPAVGMFFAELGAEVIKVENPSTGGDPTRGWRVSGESAADGRSAYFCSVNWGKRSVALDLSAAEDRAACKRLLRRADILLMNFKPQDARKLGFLPEDLLAEDPALLVGWLTGYGSRDERPGFDALIQAESGFIHMNGPVEGPPCKLPVAFIDLLAAHQLKEGLLLGLLARERTGLGRVVEVSLWDTALSTLCNVATNYLMAGLAPARTGTEHPNLFPYGTLLGDVLVAVGTDRQFAALCEVLGTGELVERYATNAARVEAREELRGELERLALAQDGLLEKLHAAGVPAGRLRTAAEALEHAGDLLLRSDALAGLRTAAFHGFERVPLLPPPRLGEHTAELTRLRG